jgi:CubicO group peptidase (beta-lactamase class C family)
MSYADYLKSSIFEPAGMKHSFVHTKNTTQKTTTSYDWRGIEIANGRMDEVYGDKNIYSTPRDLLIWDRLLSSGLYIHDSLLKEAYKPYSNEKPGIRNYGLGWRMNLYPNGYQLIYHNGWWHGNNAAFIRMLNEHATIIVLGNKFNRNIYKAKYLASIFNQNLPAPAEEEGSE